MARQEGPVFLEGTMGGINFYFSAGMPLARSAGGGFTRKAIKESPRMEAVRQSNREFAACSLVNKAFKQALQPFLLPNKDGTLHRRLMQLFLRIKDKDPAAEKGSRTVAGGLTTAEGRQLLREFNFLPVSSPVAYQCTFNHEMRCFSVERTSLQVQDADVHAEVLAGMVCFDFETCVWNRILAEPARIAEMEAGFLTPALAQIPAGEGPLLAVVQITSMRSTGDICAAHPVFLGIAEVQRD